MSERDPNKDIRPWMTIGEAVNGMLVKTADAYADPNPPEKFDQDCACVHFDRFCCANIRYGRVDRFDANEEFDPCDCHCHDDHEHSDDDLEEWGN